MLSFARLLKIIKKEESLTTAHTRDVERYLTTIQMSSVTFARNFEILLFEDIIYLSKIWFLYLTVCGTRPAKSISLCTLDIYFYRKRWGYIRKFNVEPKFDIITYIYKKQKFVNIVERINYYNACVHLFLFLFLHFEAFYPY